MKEHIIVADADPNYFQVGEDMLVDYAEEIEDILFRAYGDGVVSTVEQVPCLPFAMGHTQTELTVRPARKPQGWRETERNDSGLLSNVIAFFRRLASR